jgi:23S rRNA (pseudouridine1915-N3)-methyltransferase
MKIKLIVVGKTDASYIQQGIDLYANRLKHYVPFHLEIIPDIKNTKKLSEEQQKVLEGQKILEKVNAGSDIVLLDEKGKEYNSVSFSSFLQKKMNSGIKELVFVVGGPYGFSKELYSKANGKVALSQMTFSHQMVRLFFVEQIYRGMTILKGEPYHHQ